MNATSPSLWRRAALPLAAILLATAPSPSTAADTDTAADSPQRPLVIASKIFTENRLLAEIMAQLIENRSDISVRQRVNLGGSLVTFRALTEGEIDLYPEYTGTLWYGEAILNIAQKPLNALHAYSESQQKLAHRWDLHLLTPFGFNNTYVMTVHNDLATRLNLRTVSDLAEHIGDMKITVSHEFLQRADGWPGLAQQYGLEEGRPQGIEHGLIYHALAARESDLADSFSTDGKLLDYPVTMLEDDKNFFPPYQGVPLISGKALQLWPELRPLLGELGFRIDDDKMRRLNWDAETDGNYARVARAFLESEGLLSQQANGEASAGLASTAKRRWQAIRQQTAKHLFLSLLSTLIATLIALPLGIFLARHPLFAAPVIWLTGMLQTIPALALFALLITLPGFGLGDTSAITAISLYAILPVLRNVCIGINEVDAKLTDTARALGLNDWDILLQVELPLATPTIMAGIRTAAVISVGMATLAAFVGAGGLGDSILTGLQLVSTPLILAGAVPAALLALLTDLLLGVVEKYLRPKGLRVG